MTIDSQHAAESVRSASAGEISDERQEQRDALFAVEGMTCASCAMRIERGLKKVPGVTEASVNLATERATVRYDPVVTDVTKMVQKVDALGYKAIPQTPTPGGLSQEAGPVVSEIPTANVPSARASAPPSPADAQRQRRQAELARKRILLILGVVLSVPVVLLNMFFMNRFPGENVLLLVLTTPIWAVVGWEFHRTALKTARHFGANKEINDEISSRCRHILGIVRPICLLSARSL